MLLILSWITATTSSIARIMIGVHIIQYMGSSTIDLS